MSTTVTSKGQVTIPKAVRERFGLKPGSKVTFSVDAEGRLLVETSGEKRDSVFRKFLGHAGPGMTTDEIMALTRGED